MARVTRFQNFYTCRLLNATDRLRVDDTSEPATCDGRSGYGHPRRIGARPGPQGELLAKRVNGKPVNVTVIRWARRIIPSRAFAVVRLARPRRKSPGGNIGGLRSYVEDDPVDIRRDGRRGVVHDQREGLCPGGSARPVNRRMPARAVARER